MALFYFSELPPINVNDYGSKLNGSSSGAGGNEVVGSSSFAGNITGATVGFRPKSILRQSKSEDWQEENSGSATDNKAIAEESINDNVFEEREKQ